ncbi:hypothetical protein [Paenibacillus sp. L3-i20]|uniref:hypothetical protein n=1 Tax=Paenibacillus sp. L3-i20 TaxID=2905833 RepID=UPI0020BEED8D|nr:hypothetical protein [Paenibacillus sp. L3-i20]
MTLGSVLLGHFNEDEQISIDGRSPFYGKVDECGHLVISASEKWEHFVNNQLHFNPVLFRYEGNTIIIDGEQLCDKWTTKGTIFVQM